MKWNSHVLREVHGSHSPHAPKFFGLSGMTPIVHGLPDMGFAHPTVENGGCSSHENEFTWGGNRTRRKPPLSPIRSSQKYPMPRKAAKGIAAEKQHACLRKISVCSSSRSTVRNTPHSRSRRLRSHSNRVKAPPIGVLNDTGRLTFGAAWSGLSTFSTKRQFSPRLPLPLFPGFPTDQSTNAFRTHARQSSLNARFSGLDVGGMTSRGKLGALFFNDNIPDDIYEMLVRLPHDQVCLAAVGRLGTLGHEPDPLAILTAKGCRHRSRDGVGNGLDF